MTIEDKELLLIDLCTRLPYGVVCAGITYELDDDGENYISVKVKNTLTEIHNYKLETVYVRLGLISTCKLETVKPYLRLMSSMTEEEDKEWQIYKNNIAESCDERLGERIYELHDWFNSHHFDYRGLIEKGLAIEAPKDMYNIKKK